MKLRFLAASIWIMTVTACTLTGSDQRGDLSLQGTIFEGFSKITASEDFDASQIEGAYYSCRKTNPSNELVQFACTLKLPDGDSYDGAAFQESVVVHYGGAGSTQSLQVKTSRPAESSTDHFLFAVSSSIAGQIVTIKADAPVVLSSQ